MHGQQISATCAVSSLSLSQLLLLPVSADMDFGEFTLAMDRMAAQQQQGFTDDALIEDDGGDGGGRAPAGSHFMGVVLEQKRQLVDIYSALANLRKHTDSVRLGGYSGQEGADLRRARGAERLRREAYEQESPAEADTDLEEQSGFLSNDRALERFAKIFALPEDTSMEALAAIEPNRLSTAELKQISR
jgi:hypothetical protein